MVSNDIHICVAHCVCSRCLLFAFVCVIFGRFLPYFVRSSTTTGNLVEPIFHSPECTCTADRSHIHCIISPEVWKFLSSPTSPGSIFPSDASWLSDKQINVDELGSQTPLSHSLCGCRDSFGANEFDRGISKIRNGFILRRRKCMALARMRY